MASEDTLGFLTPWVQMLVPQPCFDEFFVKFNLLHVVCLKALISKGLGYGIILGSILVKVPQIVKILRAGSATGISIVGVTLELIAVSSTMAYGYAHGFPFSAYGEAGFLFLQTWIIAFLVFYYNGNTAYGIVYSLVFGCAVTFLMSGSAPADLLWLLQASTMPNIVMGRMIQAYSNYKNSSTGQLAAITVFLLFAGSLARIFTSYQETGDMTMILTYIVSTTCNCIITMQMLYYWNAKQKTQ